MHATTASRARFKLGSILVCCGLLLGASAHADPISDAGLSQDQLKDGVVASVFQGRPYLPISARRLGAQARAEFVKAAGAVAIAYYRTGLFRQRYLAMRDAESPKFEPMTSEEMQRRNAQATAEDAKGKADQKNMVANFEAQRADLKKAGMSDAQINQIIAQLRATQTQLAQMQATGQIPAGPVLMTEAQRKAENSRREELYRAALAKYDSQHPRDPNVFLRGRLEEFLRLSATVDFAAKIDKGRFVRPEYEKQSEDWKFCFRAGKPAVDAARAVASEWLKIL
jgi:hypothetical protein